MSTYRIGIARFWHESNSFSPLTTGIADFASYAGGVAVGAEVLNRPERSDEIAGFAAVLGQDSQVETVPLLSAGALPVGLLTEDTVQFLEDLLRRQLQAAGRLDGVCLATHGAISGATIADLDGYFLELIRAELGYDVPIIVALDCHAMVTRKMVDLATALIAYRTHPHVDLVDTGRRAAAILLRTLRGEIQPVTRHEKIPMLLPPPDDGTNSGALKELFDKFIAWDSIPGVIACSLCPAFAWQDVPEQGWTALAVTDGEAALAERLAGELADACWELRHQLLPAPMQLPEAAVRAAAAVPGCPVVITDSADTVGGGAPGDNTVLLQTLLALRDEVDGLILAHLPDPEAASTLSQSQAGDIVTVAVGGKRDTRFCEPVTVTAQVMCVTGGAITDDGKFSSEPMVDVGKTVCLGIDNVRLVVTERVVLGPQPSLFRKVGIEPFDAKIVTLKTGVGYKATYAGAAKAVIRSDCPGAVSYNLGNFEFKHLARPMFPLDLPACRA